MSPVSSPLRKETLPLVPRFIVYPIKRGPWMVGGNISLNQRPPCPFQMELHVYPYQRGDPDVSNTFPL